MAQKDMRPSRRSARAWRIIRVPHCAAGAAAEGGGGLRWARQTVPYALGKVQCVGAQLPMCSINRWTDMPLIYCGCQPFCRFDDPLLSTAPLAPQQRAGDAKRCACI